MESISSFKQNQFGSALKKKLFQGLESLLPMPQVVLKAQNLLTDPNSSFEDLAGIIETDQEITRNILNLSNSAYYSLKNEVCSVRQACVILGLSVIGEIIVAAGTSRLFNRALEAYDMNPLDLWQHSLAVALGSRKIADAIRPDLANEAFLSGLFHDTGKIILDEHIFSRNEAFRDLLAKGHDNHFKAEKDILGFDHAEVASELCKKWKFPKAVTKAIRFHHSSVPRQDIELAFILHVADNLTRIAANDDGNGDIRDQIDENTVEFLVLDENALSNIMYEVNESVRQITDEIFATA